MRTIGVVTGGRADYSIYLPLLRALQSDPELSLELYVTGTHLAPGFGSTVRCIEADGFTISARIDSLDASNRPEASADQLQKGSLVSRSFLSGSGQTFYWCWVTALRCWRRL